MIYALKNLSIRIWISVAVGGLAALGLLMMLGSPITPEFNLSAVVILMVLVYLGSGWALNRLVTLRLRDCLDNATAQERATRIGEAEASFRKAIVLFDSFMVSPLLRRRLAPELAGRVARFHMARAFKYPKAEAFITSYLRAHPEDAEISEYWLQNTRLADSAGYEDLALADRIAAAQPNNMAIQGLMAQVYLARRRTDYTALQTYRRMMHESGYKTDRMIRRLADLFVQEGRADEWALEVYLEACGRAPDHSDYFAGLAACLERVPETERNALLLDVSRQALRPIDNNTIQKLKSSFHKAASPASPAVARERREKSQTFQNAFTEIRLGIRRIARIIGSGASKVFGFGKGLVGSLHMSARRRYIIKWIAVSAFAAVVVVSAVSTGIYIHETKAPPAASKTPAEPQMATSGRYTIQVASFLKQEYAIELAGTMKERGYPAYWGKSHSSSESEKAWYYVRISRFKSIKAAKDFGETLKSKGVINDFFVANYVSR